MSHHHSKKAEREDFSRRDFLKGAAAVAAGGTISSCSFTDASAQPKAESLREPVLRIAHLTDIHVKPEGNAPNGMRQCFRHVHARTPKPDLILNGGDAIMSALGTDWDRAKVQWDLWNKILSEENSLPIKHCIGNHDIWGWQRSKAGTTGNEPKYGKVSAMEALEMESRYYSFDQAGWHFIVLDSVQERGDGGYLPVIDDEQFEWFASELQNTPATTPILILSHVPILSVGPFYFSDDIVENYQFKLIGALMHQDTQRLKDLLYQHNNVKLCLSGHVHLRDRVDYNGVTYLCNGAVSGSWWYGTYGETPPGYAIVNLFDDGTFEYEYVEYPWDEKME